MKQLMDVIPPRWPSRLMRCMVKKEYLEEIGGDMEELFYDNVELYGVRRARRKYIWEVLKLFRPVLLRRLGDLRPANPYPLFRNYFSVSVRGMIKHPLTSFVNLFGLAIAIGICILVYAFARWTYGMDRFHEHRHEVYLTTFYAKRNGGMQQFGMAPQPLGEMLRKDLTQVRQVCRMDDRHVIVKYDNKVMHERVRYADPSFLTMFTFPLQWGTAQSLEDMNSIVLSRDMSRKYFGRENPVGRQMLLTFDKGGAKSFTIGGVLEDFPKESSIRCDFLINFENLRTTDSTYDPGNWNTFIKATWVQVEHPSDINAVARTMEKYRILHNAAAPVDWAISSFGFEQLTTLYDRSGPMRNKPISGGVEDNHKSVIFLAFIGIFMLALACLNYINIAIVTAARRLKEIGVRKSIGATRRAIAIQFLSENIVTTFFALLLGFIFGYFVAIPWFEEINHFSMGFRLADVNLWVYLPAVLIITAVASGLYPALYISRFHVVGILKGVVKFGRRNPLTRVFLVFQLILACIFITSAVMFTQNSSYLTHRSWGYDPHEELYVMVPDGAAYQKLAVLMKQDPDVVAVAGSADHIGKKAGTAVMHFPGRQYEVDQLFVGPGYFETMGLAVAGGRVFEEHRETDKQAVVVNQFLVSELALKDPVGQIFRVDSNVYRIIGVVKDFHNQSFFDSIRPIMFRLADKERYQYLVIKTRPGSVARVYRTAQADWTTLFPTLPFGGGYQEDIWGDYYNEINVHAIVWEVLAVIAILLVSLGLYGLVRLNVAGRVKEFSIRKVLGAGLGNIADQVTRQYIVLLIISLAAGAPVSYFLVKTVLEFAYAYHMPFGYSGVIIAVLILVFVVTATVATQIRRVVLSNPVQGLKTE